MTKIRITSKRGDPSLFKQCLPVKNQTVYRLKKKPAEYKRLEIEDTPKYKQLEIEDTPKYKRLDIEDTPKYKRLEIEDTPEY